jgi:hypothetical protein
VDFTKGFVKEHRLVGRSFIYVFVLLFHFKENVNKNGHLEVSVHDL